LAGKIASIKKEETTKIKRGGEKKIEG